jgi:membrane protein
MRRAGAITKRTLRSFYDDQMTHHAAALTYYALMSLFPAVLLALSLLGLLGQYPETYNAITDYLREVARPRWSTRSTAPCAARCRARGPPPRPW